MPLPVDRRHIVFLTVMLGTFTSVFTGNATLIAMPVVAVEFSSDLLTAQWLILAQFLTISALLLPIGSLSDLIGRKKIFATGAFCFFLGSVLSSLAPSMNTLLFFRVVTAAGAAMMQACSLAILANLYSQANRGRVFGIQMAAVGAGGILGLSIGGILIERIDWRGLYFFTGCISLMVMFLTLLFFKKLPPAQAGENKTFDVTGSVMIVVFLISFIITLTIGPRLGWLDLTVLSSLIMSVLIFLIFIWHQKRTPHPLIDFSLFRGKLSLSLSVLAGFLMFMGTSSIRMLIPFFLFFALGFGPEMVGLVMLPGAFMTAVLSPLTGRFSDYWGARKTANVGLLICMISLVFLSFLQVTTPVWQIILLVMLLATGMAAFYAPNNSAVMNMVPKKDFGLFSGMLNLSRTIGNSLGIASATAIVAIVMASHGFPPQIPGPDEQISPDHVAAFTEGCRLVFRIMGLIALANVLSMYFSRPKVSA